MLSHYGLVMVLRIKAYTECTIRFIGICKQRYPPGRLGDRCYNTFSDHIVKNALYLLPVLNWDLVPGMLNRENTRVGPDGIGPGHVANGVKGVREGSP